MSRWLKAFRQLAFTLGLALSAGCAAAAEQKSAQACGAEDAKYLNLSMEAFDQTVGGGFREVADRPGCQRAAADLVAKYRDMVLGQQAARLDFHEAQLRAGAGETDTAIRLFRREMAFKAQFAERLPPWDRLFTEAIVAFLEKDRATLTAKRDQLAALPKPPGFDDMAADLHRRFPQGKKPMTWPMNLNHVQAYLTCFDRAYADVDASCYGPEGP